MDHHKSKCKPRGERHVALVSNPPPLTSTNDVLNEDVLLMIASYLAAPDIRSLSATSRQLSYVARPRVLAKLEIKRFHEFDKAYELYMSDGARRLEYLRELKMWLGDRFVKRIAVSFADLLEKAPNLQYIVLNNAETWLWVSPRIGMAIQNLDNIQDLSLYQVGKRTLHVLRCMRSRPSRQYIVDQRRPITWTESDWTPDYEEVMKADWKLPRYDLDSDSRSLENPPVTFQAILDSLSPHQSTSTFYITITRELPAAPDPITVPQWPHARHLEVSFGKNRASSLISLVHAFPNLRTLRITGPKDGAGLLNVNDVCWPHLDYVYLWFPTMGYWGITCPVHHLRLWHIRDEDILGYRPYIAKDSVATLASLRRMSPVILTLEGWVAYLYFGTDSTHWKALVDVAPRLRVLAIDFEYLKSRDYDDWTVQVPRALMRSNIVCLLLYQSGRTGSFWKPLVGVLPSLRYLATTEGETNEYQWHGEDRETPGRFDKHLRWRWRRVVEVNGIRKAIPMSAEAGARIASYLYSPECDYKLDFDESMFA